MVAYWKENYFPFKGENCDIFFPGKWKLFSPCGGRALVCPDQFLRNPLGLSDSTFGSPIAKE
jgi:hypothetical protein